MRVVTANQWAATWEYGGVALVLRALLSMTGELGGNYGALSARRNVSAAAPGGQLRRTKSRKENKTKQFFSCLFMSGLEISGFPLISATQ